MCGGKHSKICLTGFAAAGMNGEMFPVLVIGKSKKTRYFKEIKKFYCQYRGPKKLDEFGNFLIMA